MKMLTPAVILPAVFAAIVFIAAYIAISPYLSMITSAFSLISTDAPPTFSSGLESIFVPRSEEQQSTGTSADSSADPVVQDSEDSSVTENPAEPSSKGTVNVSGITMPKYEQHYANLTVPDLEIDCKLYYGDSDAVFKEGAGQYTGSSLPGFGKPILIGAHNKSYFKELEWVEIGQTVIIETNYGTYKYKIYKTQIAKDTDESAYDLTANEEILMLYTCYPFGTLGYGDDRLFVYGRKISGPAVNW